uniref:Disease resistance protein At4g27190-like leucine-rich repeats domain-containing protein n=1 Tax=Populus trichocarpa TaxID=3694 RepID=A0A3N7EXT3_POPTR
MSSNIVRLPREIGKVTRLQLLDLSNCERLEVISPNALSSLTRLEDLYMGNSFVKWETEGSSSQRNNACQSELKHLSNLSTLHMQITDADNMPKDLFSSFQNLERFRIFIGDGWDWSVKDATSRTLKLKLNTVIQLEEGVNTLLKITEELHLQELNGVKSILNDLDGEGFPQLRHLHVQNCPGVQYIINSIRMGPRTAFLNLDSLFLENLDNLEKICHGQLMAESLGNLRILKVESCHRLKNLFSVSMARRLVRLEEITIIDCKIMEEVVAEESENDAADSEPIEFTQLRRLTLQCLPQFTSFHSNFEESSDSQRRQKLLASEARSKEIVAGNELGTSVSLFNTKILFPNLEDLKLSSIKVEKIWHDQPAVQPPCAKKLASIVVENCSNLNNLLTSSMVKSLAQLKRLEICNCKSMEEIVVPEGIGEGKMLFPKLLILELTGLPKLTRFCTSNLLECHSLKVLTLGKCPELKEFVSIPSSADVPAMSKPDNTKSALFDDKVAFPDLEVFLGFEMDNLKVIWHSELDSDSFCKLKILHVGHGKNLLNIFPSSMLGRFHNLENLIINDCDSVEEIFDLQVHINVEQRVAVTATQLRVVRLWNLPHLKHVWNRDPQGILSFDNLCTVHVWGCPGLRSLFPASIALNLLQLNGVKSILNDLDGEGFPQLKHLHVQNCPGIQYVINSIRMGPRTAFLNLDSLLLENLDNLEKICHGQLMAESLGNLRILKVESCHRLKNLFSVSMARRLVRIEEITIIDCKIMEEVVAEDSENDAANGEPIEFTQLRRLTLQCLPQFTSFHSNVEESSASQRRQKLLLAGDGRSKEIVAGNELGTSMALFNTKILFPNLEDLKLSSIKVEKIWRDQPSVQSPCVKNLASIAVENCRNLNYLLTSSMVESLAQLKKLEICNCKSMEEIVVPEDIGEGKMMSKMLFPKLLILSLIRLPKLTRFCTSNLLECHSLKVLTVGNCPELKEFISIPSSADVPAMSKPDNTKSALFDDKVAFLTWRNF